VLRIRQNGAAHWALRAVAVAALIALVIYIPTQTQAGRIGDVTLAFELIIAAMSLNLVLGYTGLISIGHSAFFGIGAYTTAILVRDHGWSPGYTLYVAPIVAFVVGCVVALPALRIKGIYLALVTLALAVIFPLLLRWPKLEWFTHGPRGIDRVRYTKIPDWPILGELKGREGRAVFAYWLTFVVVVITYLVCRGIVRSRVGRSLVAIRDNETAAAVMGVNLAVTKTLVFGISAALCSLAGCLSTLRTGVVTPDGVYVTLLGSIIFLLIMVIGGAGTLGGPIVGGLLYVWLDSQTRSAGASGKGVLHWLFNWTEQSPATFVFSVALIVLMFVAPYGVVGLVKRLSRKVVTVVPPPVAATPPSPTSSAVLGTADAATTT
jgi:branched-chain amino acid transport system permease protein